MNDVAREDSRAVLYAPPHDCVPRLRPGDPAVVPVFLGCDERFLPHSLEVVASFMAHAAPDNFYDVFIVETGIPREKLDVAAAWSRRYPNASLRFVDIGPWVEKIRSDFTITREFSAAVYFRLFAPGLFAEYDRMIYLDSDIAALDDIAGFYRLDLEGMPVGAVEDLVATHQAVVNPAVAAFWRGQLGKEPGEKSYNSGALVMDLGQLREMNAEQLFGEKIRAIKNSNLPDQDVLNAALNRRIKSLPLEWNCFDWMYDPDEEAGNVLLMSEEARRLMRAARPGVKIVHYAEKKPWTMDYTGKFAGHYWRYAAEAPFYEEVRAAMLRECGGMKLLSRSLLLRLQQANFRVRTLFCPAEERDKYRDRVEKLDWRRRGLTRQARFVREHVR